MDLFHTVTQTIDNVLTCDWFESFGKFKASDNSNSSTSSRRSSAGSSRSRSLSATRSRSTSRSRMTSEDKTMDTVPGGESTQYVVLRDTSYGSTDGSSCRYESIKTETVPTSKQRGQLAGKLLCLSFSPLTTDHGRRQCQHLRLRPH
jgi:hypothetical protein